MSPSPSTTTAAADADAAAPPGGMQGGGRLPTVLRFIHINDCYELENLPRFATAIREVRVRAWVCSGGAAGFLDRMTARPSSTYALNQSIYGPPAQLNSTPHASTTA